MIQDEGILEIKLKDDVAVDTPQNVLRKHIGGDWESLLPKPLEDCVNWAFSARSRATILEWIKHSADESAAYSSPNLSSFLLLDCGSNLRQIEAHFSEAEVVEYAEEALFSVPPDTDALDFQDFRSNGVCGGIGQAYLGEAPIGVGAEYSWGVAGGAGQGIRLADVEGGWQNIEEISDFEGVPIHEIAGGINWPDGHGTKVLGIVAANRNGAGATGIAYGLDWVGLAPTLRESTKVSVPDAMISAGRELRAGDVLLLEVFRGKNSQGPIERRPAVFRLIKLLAEKRGICVVEPAGNGRDDIDGQLLGDSGAIIVGAVDPISKPNERYRISEFSNYGSRVDCYAWGRCVYTTGPYGLSYFRPGTSGAAAIVAGVVAVIQGVAQAKKMPPISPRIIQSLLRTHGIDVWKGGSMAQGKVPDLRKIIEEINRWDSASRQIRSEQRP